MIRRPPRSTLFPYTNALPISKKFLWREWPIHEGYVVNEDGLVACKVYKTLPARRVWDVIMTSTRSEEHTSELQSQSNLVCRLLLEKKKERGCREEQYAGY